jgi:hypothetical protein
MKTMDTSQLLNELIDTMAHWDGPSIAEIASQILGHEVIYNGDSSFSIHE